MGFGLFKGIERAFRLDVIEAPGDEYETSADVHVPDTAIPEPGTWAMMAIGLAAGIKRYFNG